MKMLKKRLVLSVYVVLVSTGCAGANSVSLPSVLVNDGNRSGDNGAPIAETIGARQSDKGREARNLPIDLTAPEYACLKEGEVCNPLNDHCCEGYYCLGGFVPICVRKL